MFDDKFAGEAYGKGKDFKKNDKDKKIACNHHPRIFGESLPEGLQGKAPSCYEKEEEKEKINNIIEDA